MHRSKGLPVHIDVSVITKWFHTEETRVQEMRLLVIESSGKNRSRRGNRVLMVIITWMVVVVVIRVGVFAETVHPHVRERT